MNTQSYKEKIELSKIKYSIDNQIIELYEIFASLCNLEYITYYKYDYEYNDYFNTYTVTKDGKLVDEPKNEKKTYKLFLKKNKIVYGYISVDRRINSSPVIKKVFLKIIIHLLKQKELDKKLLGSDVS